ncbi:hypothetical protein J22TS1_48370 [Siminovitchia terrae]|uniref:hypothetical protein n=1 Tax=Siminovitchia terrae TaxID=1914933 RepID=UPI001B2DBB6F|nr:hypothetical protein [Siminovitchia terrae]GIN93786.1 hypothetical protein J22TS1_48370 [Siminovitchia terrae]
MIGIKIQNKSIIDRHFRAFKDFLSNTKKIKYDYDELNRWIHSITNDQYNLEDVIKATPKEMINIIIQERNTGIDFRTKVKGKHTNYEKSQYFLYLYKKFSTREDKHFTRVIGYNALKLVESLGINVCPYCNRNFINNTKLVDKNNNPYIKRMAQLDHFYPGSQFPYLAVSFFNLIPVCGSCNIVKLDDHLGVNPYEILNSDDHLIFDYTFEESVNEYTIDTTYMSNYFYVNWNKLGLNELYKIHNNYLHDLLFRIKIYNLFYRKDIENYFNKWGINSNEETLTKEDFERIILGNNFLETDLSNYPLSKLTKDIVRQYK